MVTLRPLRRTDFPLLARWLAEPLVARWWAHDPSPEALERDFGPSLDGRDRCVLLVVVADGRDVGLVQHYPLDDEPAHRTELAPLLAVPAGAVSLDYLLGEPSARGRGLGAEAVAAALADAWARHPGSRDAVVPVHADNRASWRALERAGFTRVAAGELTPDNPADSREHLVLARRRPGEELVATYDADGREVGAAPRSVVYADGLWHASAGVLLRAGDGRVLVHRRTATKALWPGHHDVLAGGVLDPGETPEQGARRELAEELGVTGVPLVPLARTRWDDGTLRCHLWAFTARHDGPLRLQPEEVAQAWWWTPAELAAHLADPAWPFVPDTRALLAGVDLETQVV